MRTAAELQAERIRREAKELVSKGDVSAKEARQEADRRIQEVEVRGRGCQEGKGCCQGTWAWKHTNRQSI